VKILAPHAAQVVRNLEVLADGTVLAGYRMGSTRWDFTGDNAKVGTMDSVADVWGQLAPRFFHERVTTRPHPVQAWAQNLDLRTPHPLPDVHHCEPGEFNEVQRRAGICGCETWNKYLARQQQRIATTGMDDKIVFRYFGVGQVKAKTDVRGMVLAYLRTGELPNHEGVRAVLAEEKRVADIVTGWNARRMNEREQAWLRIRSLAPGIQPPEVGSADRGGWDEMSLPALANDIRWVETPFGRTVSIKAWRDGAMMERAAMVLTASRIEDLRYPDNGLEPWMTYAERATDADGVPFPVEWSLVGNLKTGEQLAGKADLALKTAMNISRDYADHGEPPPETYERAIRIAKSTRDQVTTGQRSESARFIGTINAIITGEAVYDVKGRMLKSAEDVVEERAEAFRRLYGGNDLRMEFTPPINQSTKLIETVPGEPYDKNGYQRQIRLPYLAAALPTASTVVGDDRGPYIGSTRGASRRPVFHDPHYATEGQGVLGRSQNMWVVAGTLGAGKSVLLGLLAYLEVRRGSKVVIRDPSGPLATLANLPEIKPYALVINLLEGKPGILNPPSMVREPLPTDFDEPGQWSEAVARAKAERRELVVDMARRSMDFDLYRHPMTMRVLREAARTIDWYMTSTLWSLVDALNAMGDPHADAVAAGLVDASTAPLLSLMFPERGKVVDLKHYDAVLTIISTPGIRRAPDEVGREDWNPQEVGADAILRLTALFTDRLVYSKKRDERAMLILDEAEDLTDFGAGRGFLSRLGRDHSKWNIAVYLGVKSISKQMFSEELRNFVAGAFVGKMASMEPAVDMLAVLNVEDRAYAKTLMRLSKVSPGEFVHLDVDGRVGGIRIDVDYHPELKAALLTNPTPEGFSAWALEDAL
jgi:AAA domain-containing protein